MVLCLVLWGKCPCLQGRSSSRSEVHATKMRQTLNLSSPSTRSEKRKLKLLRSETWEADRNECVWNVRLETVMICERKNQRKNVKYFVSCWINVSGNTEEVLSHPGTLWDYLGKQGRSCSGDRCHELHLCWQICAQKETQKISWTWKLLYFGIIWVSGSRWATLWFISSRVSLDRVNLSLIFSPEDVLTDVRLSESVSPSWRRDYNSSTRRRRLRESTAARWTRSGSETSQWRENVPERLVTAHCSWSFTASCLSSLLTVSLSPLSGCLSHTHTHTHAITLTSHLAEALIRPPVTSPPAVTPWHCLHA